MSQENVEVVRRAYVAFNEGDLGAALAAMDPDIEWNASEVFFHHPPDLPAAGGPGRRSFSET